MGYKIEAARAEDHEHACVTKLKRGHGTYLTTSTPLKAGAPIYRLTRYIRTRTGDLVTVTYAFRQRRHAEEWGGIIADLDRLARDYRCPNWHDIQPGDVYCPECGTALNALEEVAS